MIKDLLDKVDNFFFGKKKVESKTTTTPIAYIEPNTKEESKDKIISEQEAEIWRLRTEVQTLRDVIRHNEERMILTLLDNQKTPTGKPSLLQDPNREYIDLKDHFEEKYKDRSTDGLVNLSNNFLDDDEEIY